MLKYILCSFGSICILENKYSVVFFFLEVVETLFETAPLSDLYR